MSVSPWCMAGAWGVRVRDQAELETDQADSETE